MQQFKFEGNTDISIEPIFIDFKFTYTKELQSVIKAKKVVA